MGSCSVDIKVQRYESRVGRARGGHGSNWGLKGICVRRGEQNNQTQSVHLDGPRAEGAKAERGLPRRRWSGGRGESAGGGRAVVRAR